MQVASKRGSGEESKTGQIEGLNSDEPEAEESTRYYGRLWSWEVPGIESKEAKKPCLFASASIRWISVALKKQAYTGAKQLPSAGAAPREVLRCKQSVRMSASFLKEHQDSPQLTPRNFSLNLILISHFTNNLSHSACLTALIYNPYYSFASKLFWHNEIQICFSSPPALSGQN